ncbi:MAG TPA: DUF6263 family protein [Pirellulales bacterium]|nr:DUF6263 family protein [Pirellulales bacterium]
MFPDLKQIRRITALLAVCFFAVAAAAEAAPKMLQWKFTPGKKSYYRVVQDSDLSVEGGQKPFKLKSSQTMDVGWEVNEVDADGTADMTQTIVRVQLRVTGGPGGDIEYDSDAAETPKGPAGAVAVFFENIVNQPIRIKMDSTGKIGDIVLPEKLSRQIKNAGFSPFGAMFSEEGVKQMIGVGLVQFSKKPVNPGDEWQVSRTVNVPPTGKQDQTATYEYLGTASRGGQTLEKIGMKVNIKLADEDADAKFEIEEQQSDGAIEFDLKAGQIVDLKLDSAIKAKFTINDMTLRQELKSGMKIKPIAAPKAAAKKSAEPDESSNDK